MNAKRSIVTSTHCDVNNEPHHSLTLFLVRDLKRAVRERSKSRRSAMSGGLRHILLLSFTSFAFKILLGVLLEVPRGKLATARARPFSPPLV